jgi:hypothetical protein
MLKLNQNLLKDNFHLQDKFSKSLIKIDLVKSIKYEIFDIFNFFY